jgi:predicted negative regulator of RcsB-dependent stress response
VNRWCIIEFWPADIGHWVILSALLGIAAGVAWKLWQGKF